MASSESDCVIVTISPTPIMILMISGTDTPRAADSSLTVAPELTVTGPVCCGAGCCGRALLLLPVALRPLGTRARGLRVDDHAALAAPSRRAAARSQRSLAISHGSSLFLSYGRFQTGWDGDGAPERAGESAPRLRPFEAGRTPADVNAHARAGFAPRRPRALPSAPRSARAPAAGPCARSRRTSSRVRSRRRLLFLLGTGRRLDSRLRGLGSLSFHSVVEAARRGRPRTGRAARPLPRGRRARGARGSRSSASPGRTCSGSACPWRGSRHNAL